MSRATILGVKQSGSGWVTPLGTVILIGYGFGQTSWELCVQGEGACITSERCESPEDAIADADAILRSLLSIGRAQGLREAAGICEGVAYGPFEGSAHDGAECCMRSIAAAAEKAEGGR